MTERAITEQRQQKKAKQYEKLQRERERLDLESILGTVPGRRFLWKVLSDSGVFRLSFSASDPYSTAFHEGRRSHGLALMLAIQQLDPTLYHRMAKEAHDLEQAYQQPTQEPVETDTKEPDDATRDD